MHAGCRVNRSPLGIDHTSLSESSASSSVPRVCLSRVSGPTAPPWQVFGWPKHPGIPLRRYKSVADAGLSFKYLNMSAGECLLFSKRTMHLSDPRPFLRRQVAPGHLARLAMNLRVLVKEPGATTIPFWSGHKYNLPNLAKPAWRRTWLNESHKYYQTRRVFSRFDQMLESPPEPATYRQGYSRNIHKKRKGKARRVAR